MVGRWGRSGRSVSVRSRFGIVRAGIYHIYPIYPPVLESGNDVVVSWVACTPVVNG